MLSLIALKFTFSVSLYSKVITLPGSKSGSNSVKTILELGAGLTKILVPDSQGPKSSLPSVLNTAIQAPGPSPCSKINSPSKSSSAEVFVVCMTSSSITSCTSKSKSLSSSSSMIKGTGSSPLASQITK